MQKKRSIKIISVVLILMLICVSITYVKSGNKEVLATTKEFNTESLQDNEHMHVELDSSGDKIPVPNGYVGSKATGENEIDTGYVIYEGEEEVNDSNVEESQKTRNQYVWIPVPDASEMYGIDANGKKWGKLYDFTTETGNGIDPVTGAKPLNWNENNGIMKTTKEYGNREPDGLSVTINPPYDTDSLLNKYNISNSSKHNFLIEMEQEFNDMIESLKRYGGFYIGRYETGNISKLNPVIRKGNIDITSQTWYNLYEKCQKLNNNNTNIVTGIIWGNQFDRTLMWLIESRNKTKEEVSNNSLSWGNYKNATFQYIDENGMLKEKREGIGILIPTGNSEYTKANNIYDLAGNVTDWTMEAGNVNGRSGRGNHYQDSITNVYASFRYASIPNDVNYRKRMSSYVIYKVNKR